MNSDNYEFSKSSAPQGVGEYSPYTDKAWNSINDINSGVYTNSGLSLVQFDLTSIYNSNGFTDTADLFMAIPTVMCAAFSTGAAAVAPAATTAASSLCSLKSNYQHLIHQLEIVADGKVINQMTPYASVYSHFRMLSQMTKSDLENSGVSLGFSNVIDSENSMQWDPSVGGAEVVLKLGQGMNNNRPFVSSSVAGSDAPLFTSAVQNDNCVNTAISRRVSRYADVNTTSPATVAAGGFTTYNRFYGSAANARIPVIATSSDIIAEFKPYYVLNGNIMTWYDVALIPLKYFTDCLDKIGLIKRASLVLRCYVNTGTLSIPVATPNTVTLNYGAPANSTFSNTVPFTINHLNGTSANGGIPATTTAIVAGLYIARPPVTSVLGINLGLNAVTHPMPACRMNYSAIKLNPTRAQLYIQENRAKEVVFENFITNQYNSIPAAGTFSQLVQSGIKNPVGILLVPTISATQPTLVGGAVPLGFNQWASPTDTFPATAAPIALTNLQVQLGGVNVLSGTPLNYSYENFLEQVSLADKLTSSDFGVQAGVITQKWWESNRYYWIDLSRGREADKATMRNLTISFRNQSQVAVDLLVFTVYLDRVVVDVESGKFATPSV